MNTPEEQIDKVLHALANVAPRDGMEQRMLHAMRNAGEQRATTTVWYAHPWILRSASVVVFALLAVVIAHRPSRPVRRVDLTRQVASERARALSMSPAAVPTCVVRITQGPSHVVKPKQADPPVDASYPAPPIPLTQQERLLLQLVHRDDPQQLAMLTPAALNASLQRDRQQVREFFTPPARIEPQPDPYDNISGGTQ